MILPEKQSELLRLAVSDAKKLAQSNDYVLNMQAWHEPGPNTKSGLCEVCMAGAVMARTLNGNRGHSLLPQSFNNDKIHRQLAHINSMRSGSFNGNSDAERKAEAMIRASRLHNDHGPKHMRADWEVYLKAADILEKAGL